MAGRFVLIAITLSLLTPRVFSAGCAHGHEHGGSNAARPHCHIHDQMNGEEPSDHDDDAVYFSDEDAALPKAGARFQTDSAIELLVGPLALVPAMAQQIDFRHHAWSHPPPDLIRAATPLYLQILTLLL